MCGIAGAMSFGRFRVTAEYITRMRDAMAHRGPDGAGTWVSPGGYVGLGHRRLAIIDLSDAAAQPMSSADGSLWIVFNGEIYNHGDLRQELMRLGHHDWRTDHSDTEVILHAFRHWGIDCLQRLRGMFAFALWDAYARELWLVRDRLGVKPLYYAVHHGRLAFASEIQALLEDPELPREVDEAAMYHFLSFLAAPAPMTLFQHIRKLPAATWLRVRDNGAMDEQRYWDVWDHVDPLTRCTEREIAERLIGELRTAVALRKVSDVPVGVFLSGGIDSSTNAALFQEKSAGMVKTFSIGYDADYRTCPNESHWARRVADYIGAEHYERRLAQSDLLDFLPRMVLLQGEPIADPVCVPIHYVSQLARQNGVVVCQLGEGADELFCGYPSWMKLLRAARWNTARGAAAGRAIVGAALRLARDGDGFAGELLRRASLGQPIFWSGYEAFTEAQKQSLISARLRRRLGGLTSWEPLRAIRRRFEEAAWEKSELNWMSYADLNLRLPELLLMRVDKMSMGVAVEARVPFLDHRFVELAMSIPSQTKAPNGVLKYILKRAVRGIIPNEIIDRPKQGFSAPIYEWVLNGLGEHAGRELHGFCRETDLLDRAAVDSLISNASRGKREAQQLWFVLNLALWWKQFIGGEADRTACAVSLAHS